MLHSPERDFNFDIGRKRWFVANEKAIIISPGNKKKNNLVDLKSVLCQFYPFITALGL